VHPLDATVTIFVRDEERFSVRFDGTPQGQTASTAVPAVGIDWSRVFPAPALPTAN
jgi:hypothetical protein